MKGQFRSSRRRAKIIRVLAGFSAAVLTAPLAILLFLLWFVPTVDLGVPDVFRWLRRFFVRLYSGHVLRPITLYAVSPARSKKTAHATHHV